MSSVFPRPFKVNDQAIWQNHTLKVLHYVPSCCGYIPLFHFKPVYKYEQLFHQQSQINYIKVYLFQLLHLHISVNMTIVKNINSMTLVCDGDVDK